MASGRYRGCDYGVGTKALWGACIDQVSVACFFPHAKNKGHLDRVLGTGANGNLGVDQRVRERRESVRTSAVDLRAICNPRDEG
jgi:hypothetical protein